MQALFELDMVPGHDVHEKRMYLEDQFAIEHVDKCVLLLQRRARVLP